jgi:hypothetical protein
LIVVTFIAKYCFRNVVPALHQEIIVPFNSLDIYFFCYSAETSSHHIFLILNLNNMTHACIPTCLLLVALLLIMACNGDRANTNSEDRDTASTSQASDTVAQTQYDPAMDPLTTGAHLARKMGDTLGLKMYEFTAKPGQSWGIHTHPDHTVYVIQGGTMALYMKEAGRQDTLTFATGAALISGPLTDSGKNIGKTTIKMLVTDIYRPRQ